jgi:CheY-like chemotaxis protein
VPGDGDLGGKFVVLVDDDLLIDDDPHVLRSTTMMLHEWGCRVVSVQTIGSALTKLEQHGPAPDLILADYRLRGDETGLMAIELINQFVGRPTRAIIITGETDPERIRDATRRGAGIRCYTNRSRRTDYADSWRQSLRSAARRQRNR